MKFICIHMYITIKKACSVQSTAVLRWTWHGYAVPAQAQIGPPLTNLRSVNRENQSTRLGVEARDVLGCPQLRLQLP